jgi:release factor glutamine methyltransferase
VFGAVRLLPLPGVFQPPSDARILAGHLETELSRRGMSVLDICTGSGFLALSAAAGGASRVTAVDISRRAVLAVRLNGLVNGLRVEALRGDLFGPVEGRRFDVIVSNPPYLPNPSDEVPRHGIERASEAGYSGRVFIDRICAEAVTHLNDGGVLLLVHSSVCGERETLEALTAGGLTAGVVHRERGPLGPLLGARADWLRSQDLLLEGDQEEILVFRAQRLPVRHPSGNASPGPERAAVPA